MFFNFLFIFNLQQSSPFFFLFLFKLQVEITRHKTHRARASVDDNSPDKNTKTTHADIYTSTMSHNVKLLDNLKEITTFINAHEKCVVKFSADWCAPCRRMVEYFEVGNFVIQ